MVTAIGCTALVMLGCEMNQSVSLRNVTVLPAEPEKRASSRCSGTHYVLCVQLLDEPLLFADPMPSPAAAPWGDPPLTKM
jgi:hypothetical protein